MLGLAELDKQLPQADIIILLAPLLPETRHIVNADFISKASYVGCLSTIFEVVCDVSYS